MMAVERQRVDLDIYADVLLDFHEQRNCLGCLARLTPKHFRQYLNNSFIKMQITWGYSHRQNRFHDFLFDESKCQSNFLTYNIINCLCLTNRRRTALILDKGKVLYYKHSVTQLHVGIGRVTLTHRPAWCTRRTGADLFGPPFISTVHSQVTWHDNKDFAGCRNCCSKSNKNDQQYHSLVVAPRDTTNKSMGITFTSTNNLTVKLLYTCVGLRCKATGMFGIKVLWDLRQTKANFFSVQLHYLRFWLYQWHRKSYTIYLRQFIYQNKFLCWCASDYSVAILLEIERLKRGEMEIQKK